MRRRLPNGERVSLKLAERGSWIGEKKKGLWVREIRKLTESGHQVSLISTVFSDSALEDAARLFSRWSQENFLRYMMEHFAIDLLNEYRTEEIPGSSQIPKCQLDSAYVKLRGPGVWPWLWPS